MTPRERLRIARKAVAGSTEDFAATVRTAAHVVLTAESALEKFRETLAASRLDSDTLAGVLDALGDILDDARRQVVH